LLGPFGKGVSVCLTSAGHTNPVMGAAPAEPGHSAGEDAVPRPGTLLSTRQTEQMIKHHIFALHWPCKYPDFNIIHQAFYLHIFLPAMNNLHWKCQFSGDTWHSCCLPARKAVSLPRRALGMPQTFAREGQKPLVPVQGVKWCDSFFLRATSYLNRFSWHCCSWRDHLDWFFLVHDGV